VSDRADQIDDLFDEPSDLGFHLGRVGEAQTSKRRQMPGENPLEQSRAAVAVAGRRGEPRRDQLVGHPGHRGGHEDHAAPGRHVARDPGDRGDAIGVPDARAAEFVDLDPAFAH